MAKGHPPRSASKLRRRISQALIAALSLFLIMRFCRHETAGFALSKIENNFSPRVHFNSEESSVQLSQKWSYLSRGKQSFVFLSEDGKLVLKLLSNDYQRRLFWLSFFPSWTESKRAYNEAKLDLAMNSYKIAYEELKEETALVAVHLEPTKSLPCLATLVDPLGIEHSIDLNHYAYLIQKKGELVYPHLTRLLSSGQTDKAKEAISSLLQLCVRKYRLGIADRDALIRSNFAFLDERPIQIDVGPFYKDQEVAKNSYLEIFRMTKSLREWLQKNDPSLLPFLEEELEKLLCSSHAP
jgi:hypothetical protein